jgi:hypothetical protein
MIVYDVPKVILMNTLMLPCNVLYGRKRFSLDFFLCKRSFPVTIIRTTAYDPLSIYY